MIMPRNENTRCLRVAGCRILRGNLHMHFGACRFLLLVLLWWEFLWNWTWCARTSHDDMCRTRQLRARLVSRARMASILCSLGDTRARLPTFTPERRRSERSIVSVGRSYFIPKSFFWKYFWACVRIWINVRVVTYTWPQRDEGTMFEIRLQSFP